MRVPDRPSNLRNRPVGPSTTARPASPVGKEITASDARALQLEQQADFNRANLNTLPATPAAPHLRPIDRLQPTAPTAATEAIEGPRRELEALLDANTTIAPYRRSYANLSDSERKAAGALGHTEHSWDALRRGDLARAPLAYHLPHAGLEPAQQQAAAALGLDGARWNALVRSLADVQTTQLAPLLQRRGVITEAELRELVLPALAKLASPQSAAAYLLDFHGHRFSMPARQALRDAVVLGSEATVSSGPSKFGWEAEAPKPAFATDAGVSATPVRGIVPVKSLGDVRAALRTAQREGMKVSIAGRRHSKGGQTASMGGIQLDMLGLNRMALAADGRTLHIEAGATLAQAQEFLAKFGRTLPVVQGSNLFTVGGSIGVNAHGAGCDRGPLSAYVKSVRVMTADGDVKRCSRTENPELFRHVVGGYGLFGVVLDAELDTVPNVPCALNISARPAEDIPALLRSSAISGAQLAYARIPESDDGLALHYRARASTKEPSKGGPANATKVAEVARRGSAYGPEMLDALEWAKEGGSPQPRPLSQLLSPNLDTLRHQWADETKVASIPQTYFLPSDHLQEFLYGLRQLREAHELPLTPVTVREIRKDTTSALPYAPQERLAVTFSQNQALTGGGRARRFANDAVDLADALGGSFYLPFQLHASRDQVERAYRGLPGFFAFKRQVDPGELFSNALYEKYA